MIEYLVSEIGAHRVLYGTDCIMRDAAPQLGWVAWAKIPLEAKRRILGLNFADILRLPAGRRKPRPLTPPGAGHRQGG
jgi:predicted TIM-barrel fold metal-dependent hydrolase